MMTRESRLAAIRAAAQRQAREHRQEEHQPRDAARYAGHYERGDCGFTLVWSADEIGYRRRFDPSGWVWDEAVVYSTAEVKALLADGAWKRSGAPAGIPSPDRRGPSGGRTSHQRASLPFGVVPEIQDQRGHAPRIVSMGEHDSDGEHH